MSSLILKSGRDRPIRRKHPWIFSGAIAEVEGDPQPGETIEVYDASKEWIARAAYSPVSQIRARVWTWDKDEVVDANFFQRRIEEALRLRARLADDPNIDAYREVHAESDLLPGLIVDRYTTFRVVQFLSQGVERHRDTIVSVLSRDSSIEGLYERSDVDIRSLEGLHSHVGGLWGNEPDQRVKIRQDNLHFWVDLYHGHKTGFYLDQRRSRQSVQRWISGDVLDAFCYTGGFTIAALAAGAEKVVSVDASSQALELCAENIRLNDFDQGKADLVEADVFEFLRSCRDARRSFDTIILDPPKFAATNAQVNRATRGYKDINLLALKLLRPGGHLMTFSCSGGISQELFQKIVADAALDAGVEASVLEILGQSDDHPVRLHFPEGRYLKGLICRVC